MDTALRGGAVLLAMYITYYAAWGTVQELQTASRIVYYVLLLIEAFTMQHLVIRRAPNAPLA
jgi:hypothetical protein